MGASYRAGAFYGTYVDRESAIGKRLDKMIDRHGGTYCPIKGHPTVGLDYAGAMNDAPSWVTIQLTRPAHSFDRHDDIGPPQLLEPQYSGAIESALLTLRIDSIDVAPIGWYFAGTVS